MSNTSPPQSTVVLPFLQPSGPSSGPNSGPNSGPSSTSLYVGSVGANNQATAYNKYDKVGGKRRHKHSKYCKHISHRKRITNKCNRKRKNRSKRRK